MSKFGYFSGEPKTVWLTDALAPDRNMKLLEDFFFVDDQSKTWRAPEDSVINGASIPEPLWSVVGSPYTGDYRRASIVHDVACDEAKTAEMRKAADRMFYLACRAGSCGWTQAKILYLGVRIGAFFDKTNAITSLNRFLRDGIISETSQAQDILSLYHANSQSVIDLDEEMGFAHLESVVSQQLGI